MCTVGKLSIYALVLELLFLAVFVTIGLAVLAYVIQIMIISTVIMTYYVVKTMTWKRLLNEPKRQL